MRWSIKVTGKVQGVFYRKTAQQQGEKTGLRGTVQNMPDGSVLIHASGTEEQLQEFAEWCRQGPGRAEVDEVVIASQEGPDEDLPWPFSVIRH